MTNGLEAGAHRGGERAEAPSAGNAPVELDGASPGPGFDRRDEEWIARRFAGGPLVFGVLSCALSPLVVGLLLGAAGLRSGIDLWRSGTRRPLVGIGVAANLAGIVASVVATLLWGAVLAGVLLGRDAIREAERWRGRSIDLSAVVPADGAAANALRTAVIFVDPEQPICRKAIGDLVAAQAFAPQARIALVDTLGRGAADMLAAGAPPDWHRIDAGATLPPPLDAIVALPTLIVVDPEGRIEKVLIGPHEVDAIARLLRGDAKLPPRAAGGAR